MAFGEGDGEYPDINQDMLSLVNERYRGDINVVDIVDGNNIKVSRVIPSNVGGFYIREIGIYDNDEDLIAVGIFPQTYKPSIDEGATKDVMANMIINIGNTEVVELKIDPNVTVATMRNLEDSRQEILAMNIIDERNRNGFRLIFRDNIPYFRVEKGDE